MPATPLPDDFYTALSGIGCLIVRTVSTHRVVCPIMMLGILLVELTSLLPRMLERKMAPWAAAGERDWAAAHGLRGALRSPG